MSSSDDVLAAVMAFLDENETSPDTLLASPPWGHASPTQAQSPPYSDGETSSATTGSVDGGNSPPRVQQAKKPAAPRRRTGVRADKRQREELIALREEALALQDRVEELRNHVMTHASGENTSEHGTAEKKIRGAQSEKERGQLMAAERRKLRAEAWQAISEVQARRRTAAEDEREHLKGLVAEQKKAFRRLRRYLDRHVKHMDLSAIWILDDDSTSVDSSDGDEAEFEELSRAIPSMYLQTGALFNDSRLDQVITGMRDLRVQNDATSKMSIEALDSRVVPFNVMTTADAVWQHHLTKVRRLDPVCEGEKLEITENTIRRTFDAAFDMHCDVARARGRVETRRFVEDHRVVIIQTAIFDHITVGDMQDANFSVRQFQWTVIGSPRNPILRESGKELSQLEIFEVGVPAVLNANGANKEYLLQAMKRGCMEAVSIQLEFERQSVENILMQQLLRRTNINTGVLHG